MPSTKTVAKYSEAMRSRPEEKGELGYRCVNINDPPSERIWVARDPDLQPKAEKFLWDMANKR